MSGRFRQKRSPAWGYVVGSTVPEPFVSGEFEVRTKRSDLWIGTNGSGGGVVVEHPGIVEFREMVVVEADPNRVDLICRRSIDVRGDFVHERVDSNGFGLRGEELDSETTMVIREEIENRIALAQAVRSIQISCGKFSCH